MKANSSCQRSEKDVSPTCFYFDEIFILNITLLLFDRLPPPPSNLAPGEIVDSLCSIDNNVTTVFDVTPSSSRVPQKKVSHILEVLNSVSHKTDSQCQRPRTKTFTKQAQIFVMILKIFLIFGIMIQKIILLKINKYKIISKNTLLEKKTLSL